MPDDTSTALTAKPIPSALTISPQRNPMNVAPQNMAEAIEFARVMCKAGDVIRPAFRNNAGACLALALQAFRWAADPFAVANKAYLTRNKAGETQIAYEAQLIDAIVHTAGVLSKRLRLRYEGQGTSRKCIVTGWIKGEDEPFEYESPTVAEIAVKNSPLWTADRDQQLAYYSKRAWARRHVPEILLGIYTTDEIEGQIIDVTADRIDAHAAALQPVQETKRFAFQAADHTGEVYEFRTPESACDACRRILITAAAISPDALATAWENNGEFIATLREAEYGSDADALERLHQELAPQDSPVSDQPEQKGVVATVADHPLDRTDTAPPMTGDTPAPDQPAQRAAVETSTQAPAAERPYHEPQADAPAEPPPRAESGDQAPTAADMSRFQGMPVAQTADRHDPFWDRDSLRIEPPTGRTGKADYKAWSALIIPRIRQAWTIPLVNELHDANQDLIDLYGSNFGSRPRDELIGEFEDAKNRLQ